MLSIIEMLKERLVTKYHDAGEILVHQEEVADKLFLIQSGVARLVTQTYEGDEVTFQFFSEGQFVASFESFYRNQPSQFTLEAVTSLKVQYITKSDLTKLQVHNPELELAVYKLIADRMIDYTKLFYNRIVEKPEYRYQHFLEDFPQIVVQVPDYMIASYLGITPVSLSRIKKRLS